MIPAGARCAVHGDVAAVDLCRRCGRFLCGECVQLVGEDAFCADCVGRNEKPASWISGVCLVTAPAAWLLFFGALSVRYTGLMALGSFLTAAGTCVLSAIEIVLVSRGRVSGRGLRRAIGALLVSGLLVSIFIAAGVWAYLHRP